MTKMGFTTNHVSGRLHKDQRVLDGKLLESYLVCETFCH